MDSGSSCSRDRISNLPDGVLCHILSFLPTKFAVGTSVLSRRWRYLWASIPDLDFCDVLLMDRSWVVFTSPPTNNVDWGPWLEQCGKSLGTIKSFVNFVNRVLLLNEVSHIQKFRLTCGDFCKTFVHTWVCAAIRRNVQELNLLFFMSQPMNLPHKLFTCETLVSLKLSLGIHIDIPASVWLPSLKILHLHSIKYMNDDTANKLLCGCPVLEELLIERQEQDKQWDFNVSSPTLKFLQFSFKLRQDVESDNREYKLLVNAPNLGYLIVDDYASDDYLVENLSSLVKAYINVGSRFSGDRIYKLLSGISNVKFLSLCDQTLSSLSDNNGFNLPTFYNVTHLELYVIGRPGWKLLTDFLESSPNLEVLLLNKGKRSANPDEHWTPLQHVPHCLALHLREIEIMAFHREEYELEAIKYMLKNSKVLKRMTINCQDLDLEEESSVCKKLSRFPRGAKSCQLCFLF